MYWSFDIPVNKLGSVVLSLLLLLPSNLAGPPEVYLPYCMLPNLAVFSVTFMIHVHTDCDKIPPTHPGAMWANINEGIGFICSTPIPIRTIGVNIFSSHLKNLIAFVTSIPYPV